MSRSLQKEHSHFPRFGIGVTALKFTQQRRSTAAVHCAAEDFARELAWDSDGAQQEAPQGRGRPQVGISAYTIIALAAERGVGYFSPLVLECTFSLYILAG